MVVASYHNPDCGISNNVLAIMTAKRYTPTVIEYLKAGWTKPSALRSYRGLRAHAVHHAAGDRITRQESAALSRRTPGADCCTSVNGPTLLARIPGVDAGHAPILECR
jgi:hypothetical protein